jgi:hypothetical protein
MSTICIRIIVYESTYGMLVSFLTKLLSVTNVKKVIEAIQRLVVRVPCGSRDESSTDGCAIILETDTSEEESDEELHPGMCENCCPQPSFENHISKHDASLSYYFNPSPTRHFYFQPVQ